ncbi:hypothetical protein [Streptomyces sp. NBC_00198]|uniref:hypothetical protein n=1 Tax=Streptomyces sp. NBC_00198 TaxID=2975677 RepID=UPI00225156BB|nr:hypothetical protein [Streptomyces sp. NBC_00198]MCX5285940.1 hypothetical protein [Streptomyces sp. NBC_00198]MCX5286249.1 hypothetical protein [Streptomyces sp. NBC_00198]
MAADWDAVADVLERAATAMVTNRRLNPDAAVRLAVWGSPDTPYPDDDNAPGCDLFDEAASLIECFCGWQGNGIAAIPADEAIDAARTEAERVRPYGSGR